VNLLRAKTPPPTSRTEAARIKHHRPQPSLSGRDRTKLRVRRVYLLAVVWVCVGSALYAIEVLKLVRGLG
jgi:hypothetical protein